MYTSLARIALYLGLWLLVGIQQDVDGMLTEGYLGLRIVFWALLLATFAECILMVRKVQA